MTGAIGLQSGWQCAFFTCRRRLVLMEKLQLHWGHGKRFTRSSTHCSAPMHAFNARKSSVKTHLLVTLISLFTRTVWNIKSQSRKIILLCHW